jgi:NDP-sugar pyrophosphorylase family protein
LKAVVLAGGVGKRLRPLTVDKPKVMVPINGEPLLAHVLRGLASHVTEVILVVDYLKEMIMSYFGQEFEGLKITYVFQQGYKGTADALLCAENEVNDKFLLVYGDLFFDH